MCECKHHNCATCAKTELDKQPIPHKHAVLIKAWADGATIELWNRGEWKLTAGSGPRRH